MEKLKWQQPDFYVLAITESGGSNAAAKLTEMGHAAGGRITCSSAHRAAPPLTSMVVAPFSAIVAKSANVLVDVFPSTAGNTVCVKIGASHAAPSS